jgi:hypothetical protein
MRTPVTPPTPQTPQYLQTTFATDATPSHGGAYHHATRPTHPTLSHASLPGMSRRPTPPSARPRHQPHTQSLPALPMQLHTTFHPASADTQPPRPTTFSTPHSPALHLAFNAMTIQQWSGPPPLDFSRPSYRCIPLPEMTHGPVMLEPMLAYSSGYPAQNELDVSEGLGQHHHDHICAPATKPSLGSMTILLPTRNGRGIAIHASLRNHAFVTIGDVLEAIDTLFLGKPSEQLSSPVEGRSCLCSSRTTTLHTLRSRYEWAGLTRNEEGFDVWDLRIG